MACCKDKRRGAMYFHFFSEGEDYMLGLYALRILEKNGSLRNLKRANDRHAGRFTV